MQPDAVLFYNNEVTPLFRRYNYISHNPWDIERHVLQEVIRYDLTPDQQLYGQVIYDMILQTGVLQDPIMSLNDMMFNWVKDSLIRFQLSIDAPFTRFVDLQDDEVLRTLSIYTLVTVTNTVALPFSLKVYEGTKLKPLTLPEKLFIQTFLDQKGEDFLKNLFYEYRMNLLPPVIDEVFDIWSNNNPCLEPYTTTYFNDFSLVEQSTLYNYILDVLSNNTPLQYFQPEKED